MIVPELVLLPHASRAGVMEPPAYLDARPSPVALLNPPELGLRHPRGVPGSGTSFAGGMSSFL
ncbi:MAG: hypothetical protein WCH61_09530 [bacterium]